MNKRQDLRLLPQALMFIAVEAGFLETPEEAAQGRVNYLQISKVYFQVPLKCSTENSLAQRALLGSCVLGLISRMRLWPPQVEVVHVL